MTQSQPAQRHPIFNYENGLLIVLGVSFGFAFFDRNTASVLIPYMAKDLALTNTQSALINSVLSIMWALGAYVIAREASSTGNDRARPERIEHAEKIMRKASRNGLRLPFESDHRAIT